MPAQDELQCGTQEATARFDARGAAVALGSRLGHVDIGKMMGRERRPTTAPMAGVTDVPADRQTLLGCAFPIPWRCAGQRDERYRPLVVRASEMMLRELEEHGTTDARRIAADGPDGAGWRVEGRRVTLTVDETIVSGDPQGRRLWQELQRQAARVDSGPGGSGANRAGGGNGNS